MEWFGRDIVRYPANQLFTTVHPWLLKSPSFFFFPGNAEVFFFHRLIHCTSVRDMPCSDEIFIIVQSELFDIAH